MTLSSGVNGPCAPIIALETAELLASEIVPRLARSHEFSMTQDQTSVTRAVIDCFYVAYLGGDLDGMLVELAEDAVVTFAGHGVFHGKTDIRPYMEWGATQLPVLRFNVLNTIVDGERAAVNWDETGRTKRGDAWTAIGCDVFLVMAGKIVELTVYGDTEKMSRLMDAYPGSR